jgi:alpha-D-ribose 1-methylphosphonate 5-triphosphate synthase subunit PhnG
MSGVREKSTQKMRQRWMSVLAKSSVEELEEAYERVGETVEYHLLRKPETGLIMVRGRARDSGTQFNLGEMTVTHCTLETEKGTIGTACVMGCNHRHAEMAALFDALLQESSWCSQLLETVISPIEQTYHKRKEMISKKTASTKVDFFTMIRGE